MTRFIGFGLLGAICAAAAIGHFVALRSNGRYPNLIEAVDWLQARRSGRALLFAGWAFAGWHFFVR